MQETIPKHDPFAALRIKEFLFFLNTRFFLTLAIQMQSVIVAWQIYHITHDKLALGLIGLAVMGENLALNIERNGFSAETQASFRALMLDDGVSGKSTAR